MSDDGLAAARGRVREAFGVHGWNPSSLLIEAVARAARADVADTVREARVEALRDAETQFRLMARAGYNAEIVSGIEGCADHIADQLDALNWAQVRRESTND